MELEENGSLLFLDTLLIRRNDCGLDVDVYRKPTHMDRYLQFSSHHPSSSLFHRARTIAVGENVSKEERHLSAVLETNGYPDHFIQLAAKQKTRKEPEEKPKYTVCLPYVSGISERGEFVGGLISELFATTSTLRQQLTRVKDRILLLSLAGVVCRVPCGCGIEYIGETKRTLATRLKEHQSTTRCGEVGISAIAEHT